MIHLNRSNASFESQIIIIIIHVENSCAAWNVFGNHDILPFK